MRLVIFDCDGTLIDSQHMIVAAIGDVFSAAGLKCPDRDQVTSIIGLSLPEAFAILAHDQCQGRQLDLATRYKEAFTARRGVRLHDEPLFPGIRESIDFLARDPGVILAIATGKSRRGVDRLLQREKWESAFTSIQTADTHPSKPHPSMVLEAMRETGTAAANTVVIGDTSYDMEMARSAGAAALGVAWGYHPVETLRQAGAHHVSERTGKLLEDIERVFDNQGLAIDRIN